MGCKNAGDGWGKTDLISLLAVLGVDFVLENLEVRLGRELACARRNQESAH